MFHAHHNSAEFGYFKHLLSVLLWLKELIIIARLAGVYALPALIYVGLGILVCASIWDFINGRGKACKIDVVCESTATKTSTGKKIAKGVGISIAAAGVFYGMYKSVEVANPANQANEADIACWGVNACKGRTACSTAFNACTSMNSCKGKGYLYVSKKECKERSGVPLKGSEGDPAKMR